MAGSYCHFCGQRCFVYREVPNSMITHFATCRRGMEYDREHVGYDYTTAFDTTTPEGRYAYRARLLKLESLVPMANEAK